MATRRIPITGRLASHFMDDSIPADVVKSNYDAAERVLSDPDKFPHADRDTLEWLQEALFELSPTAALEGA